MYNEYHRFIKSQIRIYVDSIQRLFQIALQFIMTHNVLGNEKKAVPQDL